ncbi:hypothetical protein [Psychroserpens jangbogonensis]|uniref:hypothetical protein n=1 Tax=Psychroserpens jangbogonensis TaxID=1484460 RepID=UPI00053F094C|nr:hypothetical protein [Psychroserpens jangbogonensis]
MENLLKVNKGYVLLVFLFLTFQLSFAEKNKLFVYKYEGSPKIEVNDSVKIVKKGSLLDKNTKLIMHREDVIYMVNDNGDVFKLFQTGTFNHKELLALEPITTNSSFAKTYFSYVWKEFTNTDVLRRDKSGVVYRGDDIILMRYPADSIKIYNNEIRFEWDRIPNKEKDYYFVIRNKETKAITTIGTPVNTISLMIDGTLLKQGNNYEWAITETKYPNMNKTPFYSFHILSNDEFKNVKKDLSLLSADLKNMGFTSLEVQTAICQDFKLCF